MRLFLCGEIHTSWSRLGRSEDVVAVAAGRDYKSAPRMPGNPRRFFVADFTVKGEMGALQEYRYEDLERIPGAGELIVRFSTALYRSPGTFELALPAVKSETTFRWLASAETAGIATLRTAGHLTSISLLASGLDAQADHL